MHSGFIAHHAERAVSDDLEDRFLHSVVRSGGVRHDLDLPPALLREARVHAKEIAGEDRGLVAAGARADLDDGGPVVERIGRHEHGLELALEVLELLLELLDLGARLRGHLRVVNGNELARLHELVRKLVDSVSELDYCAEALVLATE